MASAHEVVILGGGCFWCTEAVMSDLNGVIAALPGYAGGDIANPSYEAVCGGDTGHAEVVQVTFDPAVISYKEILEVFFATHNPTTLNRQGNDVGTQYRSVIFVTNDEQRRVAEEVIAELARDNVFDHPIVTTVEPDATFYEAEAYHHRYFEKNPEAGYCQAIISPKLAKFRHRFVGKLKSA